MQFAAIEDAIAEIQEGRMVIIVDDEDRENEGDLMVAAEKVTPEAINFMATHGRGLICLAMTGERLDELQVAVVTKARRPRPAHLVRERHVPRDAIVRFAILRHER